jgi:hypothetical protein
MKTNVEKFYILSKIFRRDWMEESLKGMKRYIGNFLIKQTG